MENMQSKIRDTYIAKSTFTSPIMKDLSLIAFRAYSRTLSRNAETKDFARLTSHPVRGWTGETKTFVLLGLKMAAV